MKKLLMLVPAAALVVSCTRVIPVEKYVDAMVALGCKGLMETMPEAGAVLAGKGVTLKDIQVFRRKMDPKKSMEIAMRIAGQVAACHGVSLPAGEGQPETK